MREPLGVWVGKDERGGIPVPERPDRDPPPHWRLDAVAATERPRSITVSPDGRSVAFIWDRDTSDLWVLDLAGGAPLRLTTGRPPAPCWEDTTPAWSPDGSRLAYAEEGAVLVVAAAGGPPRRLAEAGSPVWLDERMLVVTAEHERKTRLALLDVDAWLRPLADADGDCYGAVVSPDRSRVAFVFTPHSDYRTGEIRTVAVATGEVAVVSARPGMMARDPAWSPDGRTLAFTCEQPGRYEVFTVGADGAAERQVTEAGADFGGLRWAGESRLFASRADAGVIDLVTIDLEDGDVRQLAAGGTWQEPHPLPDGSVVATHEAAATPPRLCRVTPEGEIEALLAPAPAAVTAAPHVVPEAVRYRSFDGLEIPGFLYRPHGASPASPAPAVVCPHGGPTAATGDEWDGVAQYFVDRGYAWFAPNFRGSTTYGRQFERANHGVWGVDDTKDCLAAHEYLAGLGWVDPRRVAIFGASYGSYLTVCCLTDDPLQRYACGVAKYGDCDILTSWAQGDRDGRQDLERMMGHPSTASAAYRAGSPIRRVAAIRAPILVAHGERDERVHPAQSEELVEELRRLGKTYEYVTYPTEGHGLLRAGPFIHFHRRLERFLDWYLM